MTDLIPLFATLGLLAAILAHIAIWSPRTLWIKIGALATTVAFLPVAYASLATMLSRPKPIEFEWSHHQLAEAAVLGARMEEGKAIYVWLGMEGIDEPRAYVLPWDEELAKQLHGAQRDAEQTGAQVRMRKPFEDSLDDRDQLFFAAPVQPPKQKEKAPQNVFRFEHSETVPNSSSN
ncbi:MAG: hypothetical protein ACTSW2_01445 [Alphaproteobacteria bacterium]